MFTALEKIASIQDSFYDVVKYARNLEKMVIVGFSLDANYCFDINFEDMRGNMVTVRGTDPQTMRKMITEIHDSIQPE